MNEEGGRDKPPGITTEPGREEAAAAAAETDMSKAAPLDVGGVGEEEDDVGTPSPEGFTSSLATDDEGLVVEIPAGCVASGSSLTMGGKSSVCC